jgi:hypothetical protein
MGCDYLDDDMRDGCLGASSAGLVIVGRTSYRGMTSATPAGLPDPTRSVAIRGDLLLLLRYLEGLFLFGRGAGDTQGAVVLAGFVLAFLLDAAGDGGAEVVG